MVKLNEIFFLKLFILVYLSTYFNSAIKFKLTSVQEGYGSGVFPIIIFFFFFILFLFYCIADIKKKETLVQNYKLDYQDFTTFLVIIFLPLIFINFLGIYVYLASVIFFLNFKYSFSLISSSIFITSVLISCFLFSKILKLSLPIGFFG